MFIFQTPTPEFDTSEAFKSYAAPSKALSLNFYIVTRIQRYPFIWILFVRALLACEQALLGFFWGWLEHYESCYVSLSPWRSECVILLSNIPAENRGHGQLSYGFRTIPHYKGIPCNNEGSEVAVYRFIDGSTFKGRPRELSLSFLKFFYGERRSKMWRKMCIIITFPLSQRPRFFESRLTLILDLISLV